MCLGYDPYEKIASSGSINSILSPASLRVFTLEN
jgi:hypothetical protein